MKHLDFVEPNFKCEVEDPGGHRSVMYFHAVSQEELAKRIEEKALTLISCAP